MWAAAAGAAAVRCAYGAPAIRTIGPNGQTTTDADAERAILEVISEERPDDGWTGEETGSGGGTGPRRWLIDPLCGTANFVERTPLVAVNLALVEDRKTLVAVSADPIAGEVFFTDGTRAILRHDRTDVPLQPSARSRLVEVNCDGPADPHFVGPALLADRDFRCSFVARVVSTTLAFAWVAAGRRAAYVSDGWFVDNVHYAAGLAICQAAGCIVTNLTGEPVGDGRGLVVAADLPTHQKLLPITTRHLEALPPR